MNIHDRHTTLTVESLTLLLNDADREQEANQGRSETLMKAFLDSHWTEATAGELPPEHTRQFVAHAFAHMCRQMPDYLRSGDLGESHLEKAERTERLVARIQAWFREQRKELGESFDPQRYLAAPNDELGELALSMQFPRGRFPFEHSDDLRAALLDDSIGDGPEEMARVATDLNELYPEGLTRDVQITIGVVVIAINVILYSVVFRNARLAVQK